MPKDLTSVDLTSGLECTEIQYPPSCSTVLGGYWISVLLMSPGGTLNFSTADMPHCQSQLAYMIMAISHTWPRAIGNMPPLGDKMFGPWAAYFSVFLAWGMILLYYYRGGLILLSKS